jgi:hypothetical protein
LAIARSRSRSASKECVGFISFFFELLVKSSK